MSSTEQSLAVVRAQAHLAEAAITRNHILAELSLLAQDAYHEVNMGTSDEAAQAQAVVVDRLRTAFIAHEDRYVAGGIEYTATEREAITRHLARLASWGNATGAQTYAEYLREGVEPIPFDKLRVTVGHQLDNQAHGHDYQLSLQSENLQVFGVFDGVSGSARLQDNKQMGRPDVAAQVVGESIAARWAEEYMSSNNVYPDVATAVQVMRQGFADGRQNMETRANGGQTVGNAVAIVGIEGYTYAVAGNAGDCRLFLEQADKPGVLLSVTTEQNQRSAGRTGALTNAFYGTRKLTGEGYEDDEFVVLPLEPGDRLIQASDGVFGRSFTPEEMRRILDQPTPQAVADAFVQTSRVRDDKSINVIQFTQSS
jgi:serine/threonine protein phosphatase PrpC